MGSKKRVVITGVGIIAPKAIGKKRFWAAIKKGASLTGPVTLFDTSKIAHKTAGEVKNFNFHNVLKGGRLRNLTRAAWLALVSSKFALEDALLPSFLPEKIADRCGVSFGSSAGSIHSIFDFDMQGMKNGPRLVSPSGFINTTINSTAGQISIKFNIKGFNTTLSTSYVSGLDALSYGSLMIRNYDYHIVLAGAAEELTLETYIGCAKLGCLASRQKDTKNKEISCPYDKRRNGFILSEGSCMLVLEELRHALKRRAKIYGELKGFGFSFDPKILSSSDISSDGASQAMQKALESSGCSMEQIGYIAGSANSTRRFDTIEAKAIKNVFKNRREEIPVSAIKSIIGESISADGALNVGAAIGALKDGFVPPTINYQFPDKECDINIVINKPLKKKFDNVMVNSISFNGQNGSLIIGRYLG